MRARWSAAVLLVTIGAAGCQGGGGKEAELGREVADEPAEIEVRSVAADPTGGGWLLGSNGRNTYSIHHIDEGGRIESITLVPPGSYFDLLGLTDGRLALAGARCVDDCRETVTDVLFVDREGDIDASDALAREEGNQFTDDEYSPEIGILGEVDGEVLIWARSRLRVVTPDGELGRGPELDGATCVIQGEMYQVHVSDHDMMTEDTTDPIRPDRYTISRLVGSDFVPVSELEASGSSYGGQCAGDAVEVRQPDDRYQYWEPDDGWTLGEWVDDPNPAGAMAAYTAAGYVLVVDADGTLMVRRHGRWVDLPFRHDLDPELGRQLHAADLSRGALISCIGPAPHPMILADITCLSATSVKP